MDVLRYVKIEFRGGPMDGDVWIERFPIERVLNCALPVNLRPVVPASDFKGWIPAPPRVARYAATDSGYQYDVTEVSASVFVGVPSEQHHEMLKHIMAAKRPLVYTHQPA